MRSNWTSFTRFSFALAIVAALGQSAHAASGSADARLAAALDAAMRSVFYGIERPAVVVNGHTFSISGAHIVQAGPLTAIEGELVFCRPTGDLVQVHYTVRKRGATILAAEIRAAGLQNGGWRRASLTGYLIGLSPRDEQLETVAQRLGRLANGNWQSTAELIVASIALRADVFGRDRLAIYRARRSHAEAPRQTTFGRSQVILVPRADRASHTRG